MATAVQNTISSPATAAASVDSQSSPLFLMPEVVEKLQVIQQQQQQQQQVNPAQQSLRPVASKSAVNSTKHTTSTSIRVEKSSSMTTLVGVDNQRNKTGYASVNKVTSFASKNLTQEMQSDKLAEELEEANKSISLSSKLIERMSAILSNTATSANSSGPDSNTVTVTNTQLDVVTPLLNELQNLNLVEEQQLFWEHFIRNATSSQERTQLFRQFVVPRHSSKITKEDCGIPHALRRCIWQALVQSSSACQTSLSYQQLLLDSNAFAEDEIMNEDMKALQLSVHQHNAVIRVLKAYRVYDKSVGYTRGMAYVAHPLLSVMPENEAFSVFVRLMKVHQVRSLFLSSDTDGTQAHLHLFQQLLDQLCPELAHHFSMLSVRPSMYASEWFSGLCATAVSDRQIIPRLYDIALLEGALETVYRVGLNLLLKNQLALLQMSEATEIISYLTSNEPYKAVYADDVNGYKFIADVLSLSDFVAEHLYPSSLCSSANTNGYQQQQKLTEGKCPEVTLPETTNDTATQTCVDDRLAACKHVAIQTATTFNGHSTTTSNHQKQLQEILTVMAQLKKENSSLAEQNMTFKMRDMESEAAQTKLAKRNAVLEKRVKKYKVKLANATASIAATGNATEENNTTTPKSINPEAAASTKVPFDTKHKQQYTSFVDTLRETGEFGALIAGALVPSVESKTNDKANAPTTTQSQQQQILSTSEEEEEEEDDDSEESTIIITKKKLESTNTALQNVTSELVTVKLEHFELKQRYESLAQQYQQLNGQVQSMQTSQTNLVQKIIYLESELEDVQAERDQIYGDQEEVLSMAMVAKKTAAELQMEKLALSKEVERLEANVKSLEEEKKNYFMPRGSFSEEVFAAHSILFGGAKKQSLQQKDSARRHTLQLGKTSEQSVENDEYKAKYVESELRCRELEKYLAETKVKLAEYESSMIPSSRCTSPRGSLQQHRRASSTIIGAAYQTTSKRHSAASLSMLANRVSTPTSPNSSREERRESTESYASSVTSMTSLNSSNCNSKRSSVYSRIWNAFGSPTTPLTAPATTQMKHEVMCEEPQILEQQ